MNKMTIIDEQVMLDRDLAELYGVETKVFNQAVKRNKEKMDLRRSPYAFTEQGSINA